jgi:hypothetical protein
MKGIWKTKVYGYNYKGQRRKRQNTYQTIKDNGRYNAQNASTMYGTSEDTSLNIRYGKHWDGIYRFLPVHVNSTKAVRNSIVRKERARFRESKAPSNWYQEIKQVYGTKSILWLVS